MAPCSQHTCRQGGETEPPGPEGWPDLSGPGLCQDQVLPIPSQLLAGSDPSLAHPASWDSSGLGRHHREQAWGHW
jgi:hypothetical protein